MPCAVEAAFFILPLPTTCSNRPPRPLLCLLATLRPTLSLPADGPPRRPVLHLADTSAAPAKLNSSPTKTPIPRKPRGRVPLDATLHPRPSWNHKPLEPSHVSTRALALPRTLDAQPPLFWSVPSPRPTTPRKHPGNRPALVPSALTFRKMTNLPFLLIGSRRWRVPNSNNAHDYWASAQVQLPARTRH